MGETEIAKKKREKLRGRERKREVGEREKVRQKSWVHTLL